MAQSGETKNRPQMDADERGSEKQLIEICVSPRQSAAHLPALSHYPSLAVTFAFCLFTLALFRRPRNRRKSIATLIRNPVEQPCQHESHAYELDKHFDPVEHTPTRSVSTNRTEDDGDQ